MKEVNKPHVILAKHTFYPFYSKGLLDLGCLLFSKIIRMEWSLHKGKRFSEFNDQPDENGAYHLLHSIPSRIFYSILWEIKGPGNGRILANGKSISRISFRTEKEDYLWRLSTNTPDNSCFPAEVLLFLLLKGKRFNSAL